MKPSILKNTIVHGITVSILILFYFTGHAFGVSTQGMVGYWTFEGNAHDTSGCGHNGTFYVQPAYVTGRTGLCPDLRDGKNHVAVDNSDHRLTLLHTLTIEAWINGRTFDDGYHHIFGKENAYVLSVCNGKAAAGSAGGWWKPNNTHLHTNRWIHVAWTCNGSYNRIFINGKETAAGPASGTFPKGGKNYIGHPNNSFHGLIDEVKVYGRALTASEIESSYFEGLALVGYWPLDGPAKDHGGFGNYEGAMVGLGLRFSNDNDHVSINPADGVRGLTRELTMAAWIRGDVFDTGYRVIYDNSRSHSLAVFNGKLTMACAGGRWKPDTPVLETGRWYHVTGTYDGQWKKMYIDGKEVARAGQTGPMPPGAAVWIGRGFRGLIDEVKIYDRALPPGVIEQNYKDIPKPVGIWSFDNNPRDKSGCGHHGKPINGPRYTRGKINQCLHFDGNNDYVLLGNGDHRLNLWGNLSIEAWINTYAFKNDYQHIYDKYRAHTLTIKDGKLAAGGRSGWWYPTSTTLKTHEWYHVVGTYDHEEKKIYINGVLISSKFDDGVPCIGDAAYISHPYCPFNGLIDEVKVYNSTLSARDVVIRYRAGLR